MNHQPLFVIDEQRDRETASHGRSRFGVYLRQYASAFEGHDGLTTDPARFAAAAWYVASAPVMAPAFVAVSPAAPWILSATCHTYDDTLIGKATLAVPAPRCLADLRGFAGWDHACHGTYLEPAEDVPARRPVMLTTTRVLLPLPTDRLHTPTGTPRHLTVTDAKKAVRATAAVFTEALAPILSALDPGTHS